jgi:hypothetical protein
MADMPTDGGDQDAVGHDLAVSAAMGAWLRLDDEIDPALLRRRQVRVSRDLDVRRTGVEIAGIILAR